MTLIALLTDFGTKDSYVAEMKANILQNTQNIHLIDITHEIKLGDILSGAWLLRRSASSFPENTVFLVVIDPEVGSSRQGLAIKTRKGYFVGPDNGVLSLAVNNLGIIEARSLTNSNLWNTCVSTTFHGRDIFAPIAAYLAQGNPFDAVGPVIKQWKNLTLPTPQFSPDRGIIGQIMWIDRFGTIITNLSKGYLKSKFTIKMSQDIEVQCQSRTMHIPWVNFFAEVPQNSLCMLTDSDGWISIAMNHGSAADFLSVQTGDPITFRTPS